MGHFVAVPLPSEAGEVLVLYKAWNSADDRDASAEADALQLVRRPLQRRPHNRGIAGSQSVRKASLARASLWMGLRVRLKIDAHQVFGQLRSGKEDAGPVDSNRVGLGTAGSMCISISRPTAASRASPATGVV